MDGGVDHLLFDEFQDTSLAQWQVLQPLARAAIAPGRHGSAFCVGDTKQAIYGWRGGSSEIFETLTSEFDSLDHQELNKSFRSSQPVINAVNRVFRDPVDSCTQLGAAAKAISKWRNEFPEHSTSRGNLPGHVSVVSSWRCADDEKQRDITLQCAAEHIADLSRQASHVDIAALVRTNDSVGKLIYYLNREGVVASEEGKSNITDSAGVELVISLLTLVDHPSDSIAAFHLARSELGRQFDLGTNGTRSAVVAMAEQMRDELSRHGYGAVIARLVGILLPHAVPREARRLNQLVDCAYLYQSRATTRTRDFIHYLKQHRTSEPSSAAVRVMTIHQSKGLQFDAVFLPDLDRRFVGNIPSFVCRRSNATGPIDLVFAYANKETLALLPREFQTAQTDFMDREYMEALCNTYVAMTRAVYSLTMVVNPSSEAEKHPPCNLSSLIRLGLVGSRALGEREQVYSEGDADWHRRLRPNAADAKRAESPQRARPRFAQRRTEIPTGLEPVAPSQLEGGRRVRLADQLSESSLGLEFGILIHAWFESIQWLDERPPSDETLREIAKRLGNRLDVERQMEQFRGMLRRDSVKRLLNEMTYRASLSDVFDLNALEIRSPADLTLEVFNEQAISVRDDRSLLTGNIDRLVLLSCQGQYLAGDIVDFKTDALNVEQRGAVERKVEFYRPQLQAYRRAVANMLRLKEQRIAARLLFVGPGLVRTI